MEDRIQATIIALFTAEPLGSVVVQHAADEARRRGGRLVILDPRPNDEKPPAATRAARDAGAALEADGLAVTVRAEARGQSNGTRAVWLADELDAELLVIGMRRRSPVGKIVLGSGAQDALLGANCPVLAVKLPDPDA